MKMVTRRGIKDFAVFTDFFGGACELFGIVDADKIKLESLNYTERVMPPSMRMFCPVM
jgi:hypothetical protein